MLVSILLKAQLKIVVRVIMVMRTIINVVESIVFQPCYCVGIVLRSSWTRFLKRMPLLISAVASLLCIILGLLRHVQDEPWQMFQALLRPGGIFIGTMPDANVIIKKLREAEGLGIGNSVYWIRFGEEYSQKKFKASSPFGIKYVFHLEDAVDCPEWIVPFHVFKSLAEEYDLELVLVKNSHEFVHEYMKKPEFVELMRKLGALGDGNQDQSTLSADEWETAYGRISTSLLCLEREDNRMGLEQELQEGIKTGK